MFEKIKQLKQMKDIQDELGREKAEAEKDGVKVVVNGKMDVEEIRLNPALSVERQEKIVKDCVNDALKKIKTMAARKMFAMKDKIF